MGDQNTEDLERQVRIDPSNPELLVELGDRYRDADHPQRAINVYLQAAEAYGKRDAWQRVAAIYKLILLLAPEELGARSKLADVYCLIGLRKEAQDELLQLAKMYQAQGNLELRDKTLKRLEVILAADTSTAHCAFCGRPERKVQRLITREEISPSGAEVAICESCVKKCGVVLQRDGLW